MKWIFSAVLVGSLAFALGFKQIRPQVIYGEDGRQDLHDVTDPNLLKLADASVALIPFSNLSDAGKDQMSVSAKSFGENLNLCRDEAFYEQPTAANCSGFLVGEDLVATAGHCVSDYDCRDYAFVFGYRMDGQNSPTTVSVDQIYSCKEVLARELTDHQDYALIRLDRKVVGHEPMKMAAQPAAPGDMVVVVGHPAGLPTKVTHGGLVRTQEGRFFTGSTDTYGGNSGSAVLNAETLEVIGILVRGENDFSYDYTRSCTASFRCAVDACRGEDSTNISYIQHKMPK